jgi:hypothetical protein
MVDKEKLKEEIRAAFLHFAYPGDWCLRGSHEGDEPYQVEEEFKGKHDWRTLDAKFLDQAPDGLASALSFFSDEAFHFYLPAYLIADIDGLLEETDVVFHLTHGLDDSSAGMQVNPQRYGERTWRDEARYQFSMFTREEAAAIVGYLIFKRDADPYDRETIEQALRNYWYGRAGETNRCGEGELGPRR